MECNKEDAFRAKEMAEKKFFERDLSGAKKFSIKAQKLFPGLDGLSQFVATLDVYISADQRANGEIDWYRVLGVGPSADEDTIRKHYRKLALILHPDKNKSVGAEGAFKILSEAWTVLSDKVKRSAYDQKQNLRDMYQKVPNYKSSMPTGQNGCHYFFNNDKSNSTTQKSSMHPKPAPPQHFSKLDTFWTTCNFCKLQFEYLRTYINHNLFCQNCRQPFYAVEMPPPPLNGNSPSTAWTSYLRGQNSTQHTRIENAYASGKKPVSTTNMGPVSQSGTFAKVGSVGTVPSAGPTTAVRGESLHRKIHTFKEAGTNLATGSSTAGVFTTIKGERLKKKRRIGDRMSFTANQMANRNGVGDSGILKSVFVMGRGRFSGSQKFNRTRELSQLELRSMLMEKAKKNISMKLKDCSIPSAVCKTSEREMEKEKGKQKAPLNGMKADGNKCPEFVDTKTRAHTESSLANSNDDHDTKGADAVSMIVPDPDFHDFDKDRTEKSFGDNQVWAAYDDDDGMPRYYAMIHSVISSKPFRVRISWLNSKNNRELSPLNWIGSGFFKTSGDFWIGKHEVNNSLNSFSHKVNKWAKGARGTVQIYPRKGDIWALYRNWSPDWNELTPDEMIHEYDMVEVLEDYNEERGVTVAPLVKVADFKTVFRRHSDSRKTKAIPREELFRLSHQVPSYLLTGQEGYNAPRGCWELDPASMPLELLKVLAEVQEEEMVENGDKTNDPVGDVKKSKEEQLMENGETTKDKGAVKDAAKEDVAEMRKDKGKEIKGDELLVYKRRRDRK